jgi:hypothetical protein
MSAPKFKTKRKQDQKGVALKRLRSRWQKEHPDEEWEAEDEPIVTPMFRAVEGGVEQVIKALRAHADDDAQAFVSAYEQCSRTDHRFVPLEWIAFVAGISSLRLAEVAQTALYLYGQMTSKMLLSSAMPKVMRSTIKAATDEVPIVIDTSEGRIVVGKTNGDIKAMEMFHKMSGLMPLPKGAQIAIQNNFGQDEPEKTPAQGWKPPEERLREFHDMTEPKRLPSPATPPMALGGHIDQLQEETVEMLRE